MLLLPVHSDYAFSNPFHPNRSKLYRFCRSFSHYYVSFGMELAFCAVTIYTTAFQKNISNLSCFNLSKSDFKMYFSERKDNVLTYLLASEMSTVLFQVIKGPKVIKKLIPDFLFLHACDNTTHAMCCLFSGLGPWCSHRTMIMSMPVWHGNS